MYWKKLFSLLHWVKPQVSNKETFTGSENPNVFRAERKLFTNSLKKNAVSEFARLVILIGMRASLPSWSKSKCHFALLLVRHNLSLKRIQGLIQMSLNGSHNLCIFKRSDWWFCSQSSQVSGSLSEVVESLWSVFCLLHDWPSWLHHYSTKRPCGFIVSLSGKCQAASCKS